MKDNHLNVSLIRGEHKINKISSEKILKDTLMFPPRDKLINLNLNKNFCLRDKKKQMGFDILRTVFIRRGDGAGEYCYLLCDENNPSVIIAATMIIVQSRKIRKNTMRKTILGGWDSKLILMLGVWLITGMFCAIVSLSIIKYQYFRFPSECSMLPSHETWNLFSCKFNILTLTVLKQCWLQLLACNRNTSDFLSWEKMFSWKHLFLFLLSLIMVRFYLLHWLVEDWKEKLGRDKNRV